jgi:lauroyl/myristoyl acyltransferase
LPSRASRNDPGVLNRWAGSAAVSLLRLLRGLPLRPVLFLLRLPLALYPWLRFRHGRRLRLLFSLSPFSGNLSLAGYYRARAELLLRNLHVHGRGLSPAGIRVEGGEHYRRALERDRPVALLGLHMGVVELLHRVPRAPPGRSFFVLTAPAFSAPLTDYMADGRERDGKRVLGNREAAPGLRAVLRGKGVLAIMLDQLPGSGGSAPFLDLWGRVRVPYPADLLQFLLRREALLLPVSTRLEEAGVSTYRFHPAWEAPSAPAGPASLENRVRAFLEASIAWAPEQWNWSYPGNRSV